MATPQKFRNKPVHPLAFPRAFLSAGFPDVYGKLHGTSLDTSPFSFKLKRIREREETEDLVPPTPGCYAEYMAKTFLRKVASLELEEQILNAGAAVALVGVFFPWVGGEWLGGETVAYPGFRFYTSFLGIAVFFLELFVLLITIIPLTGGPALVRRHNRNAARLLATSQATILILASLSVLTKTTLEFARMELRFGIYVSLIGSLVALLYSFLRYQDQKRREVQDLFQHPEEALLVPLRPLPPQSSVQTALPTEPPPPPEAPQPEEHRTHPRL